MVEHLYLWTPSSQVSHLDIKEELVYGRLFLLYLLFRVEDVREGGLADLDGKGKIGWDKR